RATELLHPATMNLKFTCALLEAQALATCLTIHISQQRPKSRYKSTSAGRPGRVTRTLCGGYMKLPVVARVAACRITLLRSACPGTAEQPCPIHPVHGRPPRGNHRVPLPLQSMLR